MSFIKHVLGNVFSRRDTAQRQADTPKAGPGQAFGELQLKQCRYGPMLFLGPIIGKCFELYGQYSESEVALMRQFVAPGDNVIDIGANIGDLTVPLAQMVGPQGSVRACESHAAIYNVLCANLALNGLRNVHPVNAYLQSPRAGGVARSEVNSPYLSEQWTPPSMAIDDFGLTRCSLLKIDVDGLEEDILRSGEALLRQARPVLYVENDLREKSPGLLRYMDQMGYDLYWHAAPIFSADNFFGNPEYHWPGNIVSTMILGIPRESGVRIANLPLSRDFERWWEFEAPWVQEQLAADFSVQVIRGPAGT